MAMDGDDMAGAVLIAIMFGMAFYGLFHNYD